MPRFDDTRLIGPRGGAGGVGRPCNALRASVASGLRVVSKCSSQQDAAPRHADISVHGTRSHVEGWQQRRTDIAFCPATIERRCRDRLAHAQRGGPSERRAWCPTPASDTPAARNASCAALRLVAPHRRGRRRSCWSSAARLRSPARRSTRQRSRPARRSARRRRRPDATAAVDSAITRDDSIDLTAWHPRTCAATSSTSGAHLRQRRSRSAATDLPDDRTSSRSATSPLQRRPQRHPRQLVGDGGESAPVHAGHDHARRRGARDQDPGPHRQGLHRHGHVDGARPSRAPTSR